MAGKNTAALIKNVQIPSPKPYTGQVNWPLVCKQIDSGAKTQTQVARELGLTVGAVHKQYKRFCDLKNSNPLIENPQALEEFKKQRADIFAEKMKMVLGTLTEDDVKKAPVSARTMLMGVLYDKERLERGQSTSNVGVFATVLHTLETSASADDIRAIELT